MTGKKLHEKIRFIQLNNRGSQAQVSEAVEKAIDAEIGAVIDALMQITKRDDWTGGECRNYARYILETRSAK